MEITSVLQTFSMSEKHFIFQQLSCLPCPPAPVQTEIFPVSQHSSSTSSFSSSGSSSSTVESHQSQPEMSSLSNPSPLPPDIGTAPTLKLSTLTTEEKVSQSKPKKQLKDFVGRLDVMKKFKDKETSRIECLTGSIEYVNNNNELKSLVCFKDKISSSTYTGSLRTWITGIARPILMCLKNHFADSPQDMVHKYNNIVASSFGQKCWLCCNHHGMWNISQEPLKVIFQIFATPDPPPTNSVNFFWSDVHVEVIFCPLVQFE